MNEHEVRELIHRELSNLGDSMRPGGSYELSGFDPDYESNQVTVETPVSASVADEQMRVPLHIGETVPFEFHFNISLDSTNAITGVNVQVPEPKSGSFQIDGGDPHPVADFNTVVGRLSPGNHVIKGIVEADGHGYLQLLWGPAGDLIPTGSGSGSGSGSASGPEAPISQWIPFPPAIGHTTPNGRLGAQRGRTALETDPTIWTTALLSINDSTLAPDADLPLSGVTWEWTSAGEAGAIYLKLTDGAASTFPSQSSNDVATSVSNITSTLAFSAIDLTSHALVTVAAYRGAGASVAPTISMPNHAIGVTFTSLASIVLPSGNWRLSVYSADYDWLASYGNQQIEAVFAASQDLVLFMAGIGSGPGSSYDAAKTATGTGITQLVIT